MQLHTIPVSISHWLTEAETDEQKLAPLLARHLGRLRLPQTKQRLPFLTLQKGILQRRLKVVPMEQSQAQVHMERARNPSRRKRVRMTPNPRYIRLCQIHVRQMA
jgi:hypothetical protein